jgi:transporter family-2 protein
MSDVPSSRRPARVVAGVVAAFGSGVLVAVQSRLNGQLGLDLGDGFVAAFISFASGLAVLSIAMLVSPSARRGVGRVISAIREGRMPWWYALGGSLGAYFVLTQSIVVGIIGVALFTVGVVAGQMTSSILVDRHGLGSMAPRPLTVARVIGAVLAVAGVVVAVGGEVRGDAPLWVLIAPVLAGLGSGLQPAVNGQVRAVANSALTATFGNFVVGTTVLGVALLVHLLFAPWPDRFPSAPWEYLGGLVGVLFILIQVLIVRLVGVLLLGLAVLSGQVVGAGVLDLLFPVPGHEVTLLGVIGTVVTLLAVVVAVVPTRRRPSAGSTGSSGSPSR